MKIITHARAAENPRAQAARVLLIYFAVTKDTVKYSSTSCVLLESTQLCTRVYTQLCTREIDLQLYCTFGNGKIN
jgi:hypothetical protein